MAFDGALGYAAPQIPITGMTESEAIGVMLEHVEGLFPKVCPNCHRQFATYGEFAQFTEPAGVPTSYDLETGNLNPQDPVGAISFCRCLCGSMLTLSLQGMPPGRLGELLAWGRSECETRNLKPGEFLANLREAVRKHVLAGTRGKPRT